MAENNGLDISRVISVLTENPQLIAQISALARADGKGEKEDSEPSPAAEAEPASMLAAADATEIIQHERGETRNRQRLLSAFKPYLSGERARLIDSMLSIADILHSFNGR